jgi:hypothetical protein
MLLTRILICYKEFTERFCNSLAATGQLGTPTQVLSHHSNPTSLLTSRSRDRSKVDWLRGPQHQARISGHARDVLLIGGVPGVHVMKGASERESVFPQV